MSQSLRGRQKTREEDEKLRRRTASVVDNTLDAASASTSPKQCTDTSKDDTIHGSNDLMEYVIEKTALLGDSPLALGVSSLMLVLAIAVSMYIRYPDILNTLLPKAPTLDPYVFLGPVPVTDPPIIYNWHNRVTSEIQQAYEKDGVVAIRGLLDPDLLKLLQSESQPLVPQTSRKNSQFYSVHHGTIFYNESVSSPSSFVQAALQSPIPKVAAELLTLPDNESLRLIRDIFLTKDSDQFTCGFHVDDLGFWPAMPDDVGINAWIAVDDMPIDGGGSMAVAVGSHITTWAPEAHFAIGAPTNTSFPAQGYKSVQDLMDKRTGQGTCNLQSAAPHLHQRMEETARVYDVKAGDVLFMHRWLYHRTVKMNDRESNKIYRRYSLRYGPGSTIIPPGYGVELSVLYNEQNGGRTADEVEKMDGPWYPRAHIDKDDTAVDWSTLKQLANDKVPIARKRRDARMKEMQYFLKRAPRQQQQQPKQ